MFTVKLTSGTFKTHSKISQKLSQGDWNANALLPSFKEWLLNYSNKGLPIAVINCCKRFKCRFCVVIAHTLTLDLTFTSVIIPPTSCKCGYNKTSKSYLLDQHDIQDWEGFPISDTDSWNKDKWSFDYILKWKPGCHAPQQQNGDCSVSAVHNIANSMLSEFVLNSTLWVVCV